MGSILPQVVSMLIEPARPGSKLSTQRLPLRGVAVIPALLSFAPSSPAPLLLPDSQNAINHTSHPFPFYTAPTSPPPFPSLSPFPFLPNPLLLFPAFHPSTNPTKHTKLPPTSPHSAPANPSCRNTT